MRLKSISCKYKLKIVSYNRPIPRHEKLIELTKVFILLTNTCVKISSILLLCKSRNNILLVINNNYKLELLILSMSQCSTETVCWVCNPLVPLFLPEVHFLKNIENILLWRRPFVVLNNRLLLVKCFRCKCIKRRSDLVFASITPKSKISPMFFIVKPHVRRAVPLCCHVFTIKSNKIYKYHKIISLLMLLHI